MTAEQPSVHVLGVASVESSALLALEDVAKVHLAGLVGPARFELATSPLSGVRSNQLSYEPEAEGDITFRHLFSQYAWATGHSGELVRLE